MSDFADVEQFAREHPACGGVTPNAMPRPGGGYLLSLRCVCGATFDRWVSPEEARRPLPIPNRVAPVAPPTAPPPVRAVSAPVTPAATTSSPRPREDVEARVAAEEEPVAPVAPPVRTRSVFERPGVDATARAALHRPAELTQPHPRRASRGRAVWLALFVIVGLGAAGMVYLVGGPGAPEPVSDGAAVRRADDPQRAALESAVESLRELHAVAMSTTSVSVYSARVTEARAEAEQLLAASPPGTARTRVREALDLHLMAASAWRAKSLDQREAWEAVGLDPTIDLCPPLRLVADFAVQAENASRAQTRGAAVASALPLLWECANERLAALEQGLAAH
ncbi:MAG TPA: hypothetical protein VGD07_14280 [Methylomirabilota bacterium]